MLGVSHAAVVGLNFQAGWDDAGAAGYTGFPVTATAFGIAPSSWENLTPMDTGYGPSSGPFTLSESIDTTTAAGGLHPLPNGSLSVTWHANAANTSAFGLNDPTSYGPNNDPNQPHRGEQEVYYGFLRDDVFYYTSPTPVIPCSVTITGLKSVFTNSQYVVRTAASTDSGKIFTNAIVTSLTATSRLAYTALFTNYYDPSVFAPNNPSRVAGVMGGISSQSIALNDDSITITGAPAYDGPDGRQYTGGGPDAGPGIASPLSGVMITDHPIIVYSPKTPASLCAGDGVTLSVDAFGVPPLSYQWRKNHTPISGATSSTYTVASVGSSTAGYYDVVVTNAYGSATSDAAAVAGGNLLVTGQTNIVRDTKPGGSEQNAVNNGATWIASSSDGTMTRAGVLQFSATPGEQVALPGAANFQSPSGSILFWMRSAGTITNTPEVSPGAMIFTGGDGNDTDQNGLSIVQDDSGLLVAGTLTLTHGSSYQSIVPAVLESSRNVSDNKWHLIALTYDETINGGLGLYVDGALDSTNATITPWTWPVGGAQQIALGLSHKSNWRAYNGQLDDFRIYNRILTDAEIAQIYANNAVVDGKALQVQLNFDAAPGAGYSLQWTCGTILQSSTSVNGPYSTIDSATSPWNITSSQLQQFYRVQ